MKDTIIAIEKRVEELAAQSWNVGAEARDAILTEIKWLESLLPKLETILNTIGEANNAGLFDAKTSQLASIPAEHRQAMRELIRESQEFNGDEGQDRKNYSDDQDRKHYTVSN